MMTDSSPPLAVGHSQVLLQPEQNHLVFHSPDWMFDTVLPARLDTVLRVKQILPTLDQTVYLTSTHRTLYE
jgi:hypothetical protein